MTDADEIRTAFAMVVARCLLTQGELRVVLTGACGSDGILPGEPGRDALRRMSLVVSLEAGLSDLLGRTRAASWLRRPAPAFGGRSPLEALAEEAVLFALARTVAGRGPAVASRIAPGLISATANSPRSP